MKYRHFIKYNKLLLFDILEYLVEQGNMNIWIVVSSKKFLSFIIDILKSQTDAEIQTKLLKLIQNWGTDFENKKDAIPNFYKIYNEFKSNGVIFPPREEPNYYEYILKNDKPKQNYKNDEDYEYKKNEDYEDDDKNNGFNEDNEWAYMENIKNKLKVSNFEHKYRRLVNFLVKMHDNIKLANIYIDKGKMSELKEPINTIKKGNKTIMDTISSGRLKDEKLMEITLGTTEDINQTISREEDIKSGNKPNNFTSYFILNEIIPIKNSNNNRIRAKSEKKKGLLNSKNIFNRNEENNENNNQSNNNVKNVDDIFDLFSKKTNENTNYNNDNNLFNNNNIQDNNNNIISTYFSNQNGNNSNNNFMNNNNNNFMNSNNNFNQNNFKNNNNNNNINNQMNNFDLLKESLNMNNEQNNNNNCQNVNNNNQKNIYNSNEYDIYGPGPEINSNQLVNYIGSFNNNNSQYPDFNNNQNNNNMLSKNNQRNNNLNNNMMEQNFGNNTCNNNSQQMTQEDIEREQRLKELDDLF